MYELFDAHADNRPSAPAIITGHTVRSYRDVDHGANQLARYLRRHGVRGGDLVGLLVERSADAIVTILAILKAGAAYVPLDPESPADRVRGIIDEARISLIVTQRDLEPTAAAFGASRVVIDDPGAPWRAEPRQRLGPQDTGITPHALCYVLYTSGSTGRPKGVMTEHRNVVGFVRAFNHVIGLTGSDRVFQGFSLCFDGSVEEMWMAFSNGAALVVPPRGAPRFGNELARLVDAGRATVFSTVPTSLSLITEPLPSVRLLIVSGEVCPAEVVRRWAVPARRMLNVYGPTETTVNATAAECRPDRPITIGRPLPGYGIRILDSQGRPVAPGHQGELFITGPGVARGYLGQPALSARHFVDLPCADGDGRERGYRTGDRVSLDESGDLLFHGRMDNQVKIRGFRIELAEIEAALVAHDSVRAAVVKVVDGPGGQDLAAYVLAESPARGVDRDRVLAHLSSRLPPYMLPAYLEQLAVFPMLATSGKVDRKRLPAPDTRLVRRTRDVVAPRSELEQTLLQAVGRVFHSDSVSIDDDFFVDLGGYSLLAARLVSELRKDFDVDVALRDVYEHRSVAALAAHLSTSMSTACAAELQAPAGAAGERAPASSRAVFHSLSRATRAACMGLQALALYVAYGLGALPFLAFTVALLGWLDGELPASSLIWLFFLLFSCTWPVFLLLGVAAKWILIGRYRPGAYPVWGWYYFRFWLVRLLQGMGGGIFMAGTPLLPLYWRMMGARVGRGCTIDTAGCTCFDLVSIGDDTSIGSQTQLLGYRIEDGYLLIGSVAIGSRCFVGIHSTLGLNVTMGDDARLDDLSLLADDGAVPAGAAYKGSPAQPAEVSVPTDHGPATPRRRPVLFSLLHLLVALVVGLAMLPTAVPGLLLLYAVFVGYGPIWLIPALPAAGLAAFLGVCAWLPLLKAAILYRVRPGLYPVESCFYLRKWAVDGLMGLSRAFLRPLYTTIYLPPWLRLLGARIGRRAEISTVSLMAPELTELGEQSFLADGSMFGGRRVHRGVLEVAVNRVGRRSFVGNNAILPTGTSLGNGCLLGCMSCPPTGVAHAPDGTEWLGSPSFVLPYRRRVEGFDERVTHEPTPWLIAQRMLVDALRIVTPTTIVSFQIAMFVAFAYFGLQRLSAVSMLALAPPVIVAIAIWGLLCVAGFKRLLIGTFEPIIKPLWSMFVWLNEAVNGAYESVAAPTLLPLLGTPYCVPWLRLMGCKIGRHVYLDTTLFSEFDLVHIGDYAALNAGVVIQNHLFEDRIMKASTLTVGAECSVGNMAVVLYDTEMNAGTSVGALSLLMKGETLPPHSRWQGIPTARLQLPAAATPAALPDARPALAEGA